MNLWDTVALLVCVAVCFAGAGVGSHFTMGAVNTWYPTIQKPPWTPPSWLFGPVWTILYTLMGISLWLVWRERGVLGAPTAVAVFAAQLVLNALWSVLFFGMRAPGPAFAEIVALVFAILATILVFAPISRTAALLLVPYLGWVVFASALNYRIWQLNAYGRGQVIRTYEAKGHETAGTAARKGGDALGLSADERGQTGKPPDQDSKHDRPHHGGSRAQHAEEETASRGRKNRRRLWRVLLLTSAYLVVEFVGGLLTNSLALLSDAGHMLTDVASLGLALLAAWFATRSATAEKTYGYHRLEILAALVNGLTLLAVSAVIVVEALRRIETPGEVIGGGLLAVAIGGLIVNLIGAAWLHDGHAHSLNVRAAFYHMLGDLLGSLGAVLAGVLILLFGWHLADPIIALAIAALIVVSAVGVIRDASHVLIEAAPQHLDTREIRAALLTVPGVIEVHDLHVWTITSGMYSLSCHCVVDESALSSETLNGIGRMLDERFGLSHNTVQLETCRGEWCPTLHE